MRRALGLDPEFDGDGAESMAAAAGGAHGDDQPAVGEIFELGLAGEGGPGACVGGCARRGALGMGGHTALRQRARASAGGTVIQMPEITPSSWAKL